MDNGSTTRRRTRRHRLNGRGLLPRISYLIGQENIDWAKNTLHTCIGMIVTNESTMLFLEEAEIMFEKLPRKDYPDIVNNSLVNIQNAVKQLKEFFKESASLETFEKIPRPEVVPTSRNTDEVLINRVCNTSYSASVIEDDQKPDELITAAEKERVKRKSYLSKFLGQELLPFLNSSIGSKNLKWASKTFTQYFEMIVTKGSVLSILDHFSSALKQVQSRYQYPDVVNRLIDEIQTMILELKEMFTEQRGNIETTNLDANMEKVIDEKSRGSSPVESERSDSSSGSSSYDLVDDHDEGVWVLVKK